MANQSVSKDIEKRQLIIKRQFKGSVALVWDCWTNSHLLDKWWGPRQWPATTKTFDFRESGHWHYDMTGPDGTKVWSWVDYLKIQVGRFFTALVAFCDEQGVKNAQMPSTQWHVEFAAAGEGTLVTTTLTFKDLVSMQTLIEMGFEAGFTEQLDRLDNLMTL